MADSSSSSSGIGVFGLLGVLFVGLKLTGNITWSWWWVTAPFWGGFLFVIAILIIIFGIAVFVSNQPHNDEAHLPRFDADLGELGNNAIKLYNAEIETIVSGHVQRWVSIFFL